VTAERNLGARAVVDGENRKRQLGRQPVEGERQERLQVHDVLEAIAQERLERGRVAGAVLAPQQDRHEAIDAGELVGPRDAELTLRPLQAAHDT
jgi:hypothetical protein